MPYLGERTGDGVEGTEDEARVAVDALSPESGQ